MRVIEPRLVGAQHPRKKKKKPSRVMRTVAIAGTVLIIVYLVIASARFFAPLPPLQAESRAIVVPAKSTSVFLPNYGQTAVRADGYGELTHAGDDSPRPIASVSKIITALTVLDKYPLKSGQQGPTLTLNQTDVALYQEYINKDGAVVAVENGEQITEYQALQAMLMLSANNMADILARWAYGSVDAYTAAANDYLVRQGLAQTKVDDASGFSPQTVSTAREVVKLGELAMKNEILAGIVGQRSAVVPVAGEIRNINSMLGLDGIDGIKTGNTDEAGGCFLTTAKLALDDGKSVRVFVAVIGAPKRSDALVDGRNVLASLRQNFEKVTISAGTTTGFYHPQWASRVAVTSKEAVTVYRWKAQALRAETKMKQLTVNVESDTRAGEMTLSSGAQRESTPIILKNGIEKPTLSWRLRRAFTW